MGCFTGPLKNVLYIFNSLIVICSITQGIILIVLGGVLLTRENEIARLTNYSLGGFGLAVSIIVFCIAFLGCYGLTKEKSMLTIYAVVLTVLFILQIILGSLAFVAVKNINDFEDDAEKVVRDIFNEYLADYNNKEKKEVVDNVQQYFQCCGITGPTFWYPKPPPSCYDDNKGCGTLYTEGCAQAFKNSIVFNMRAIAIVSMVFAVLELVGAVVACILQRRNETTLRPPKMTDRTPLISY